MEREAEFARIVREHQAGVWRYLRLLGCEASSADDLTQETFLALWRTPSFVERDPKATAAWLRTAARRLYWRWAAKNQPSMEPGPIEQADAVWGRLRPDERAEEHKAHLRACMETLDEREARAVDLRFGQKMQRRDVGRALNMSEGGARKLLARAITRLHQCMQQKLKA